MNYLRQLTEKQTSTKWKQTDLLEDETFKGCLHPHSNNIQFETAVMDSHAFHQHNQQHQDRAKAQQGSLWRAGHKRRNENSKEERLKKSTH